MSVLVARPGVASGGRNKLAISAVTTIVGGGIFKIPPLSDIMNVLVLL